ncbi:hypothetical protein NDU88_007866 [Pleurodeles waltl]|uniref:Uncharacterized protein n=1 Tax=Pleurodeles waltl TaxID=8319 RepID=A0AAV7SU06_PLEWA|nr:hypothetical protein NDU88_007866 [Pleurodeles waltl]
MALAGVSRPAQPGVRGKKPRTPGGAGEGENGVWASQNGASQKQKAPIGSSGCTRTGAKSNFQADRDGALLGYKSREASVKKLPSDLVSFLMFFFPGTNLPVGSDLLGPLSGYAKSVSSVVIFTFGLSRFFEMKILRPG